MDSADTVYQAIVTLYRGGDNTAKENASIWLGAFQKSIHAWTISDQLLHRRADMESCYFAAQTMRSKILYSFHELPEDSYESLRDSLLLHLRSCDEATNTVIVNQLCLALVDLALQMPHWKTPILDLLGHLGSERPSTLLQLLTFVPEEAQSTTLRLGANRRSEVLQQLTAQMPQVFAFLEQCVAAPTTNIDSITAVYKCLSSWFKVRMLPPSLITPESPLPTPLLNQAFQRLGDVTTPDGLHEVLTECICQVLYLIYPVQSNMLLAQVLCTLVHGLTGPFGSFVAGEELDKSLNLGRIFIELGEALLEAFILTPNEGLGSFATLDMILNALSFHDYSIAEMSFSWWYRFSEQIYQADSDPLNEMFRPYIERLVLVLYKHVQLDLDHEGTPSDNSDLSQFRRQCSECIKDIAFITGSTCIFRRMFEHLQSLGQSPAWSEIEAALFIMSTVAKNIVPSEEDVVPRVMESLLQLNTTPNMHVAIRYTALELVGQLDEWVGDHPHFLGPILTFAIQASKADKRLATVAGQALEPIGRRCGPALVPHFGEISQLILECDLPQEAALSLLSVIAAVMSKMPPEELTGKLRDLCLRQAQPLATLVQEQIAASQSNTGVVNDENAKPLMNRDPIVWLDRLAAIFRHTEPQNLNGNVHPCLPVIEEVWPVLAQTLNCYQENSRVMERCCRCIRFAIRCVGPKIDTLLEQLVTNMVTVYKTHPHSCFLYLGSILVDEYASKNANYVPGLIGMTEAFLQTTQSLLEDQGLKQHPDTVDDLFRLCLRFVQRVPDQFFQWSRFPQLFQCGMNSLTLDHKDANESVSKFLSDIVEYLERRKNRAEGERGEGYGIVTTLLHTYGAALVHAIMTAAIYHLPSAVVRFPSEILFALVRLDPQALGEWLQKSLSQLPTHNAGGSINATPEQLETFHSQIVRASELKHVLHALRDFARLFK